MSESKSGVALPPLYQNPSALSRTRHENLKLISSTNFSFAANLPSVPLAVSEFGAACAHYPIVFVAGENGVAMPNALLSTQLDRNDFVDAEGQWRTGTYIPAYVRRYPFVFAGSDTDSQLVLCADMASERLSESEGTPLFEDGAPSKVADQALAFCNDFQRDYAATEVIAKQLADAELLTGQRITLRRQGETDKVLEGLQLVDREKFSQLSDEQFIALRRGGCLGPIYAHLASLHRLRQMS